MTANIFCVVCGALSAAEVREDFDLLKLSAAGRPAGGGEGEWYCSRHFKRGGTRRALSYRVVKETEDANGSVKERLCHDWRRH